MTQVRLHAVNKLEQLLPSLPGQPRYEIVKQIRPERKMLLSTFSFSANTECHNILAYLLFPSDAKGCTKSVQQRMHILCVKNS